LKDRQVRLGNELSHAVIGCAMKVHTDLGPGLFESVYHRCLAHELTKAGLSVDRQVTLAVEYDGLLIKPAYRADLIVNAELLLELKCVSHVLPVHRCQLLTYLRLAKIRHGLLINFQVEHLRDGILSVWNQKANLP